MSSNTPSGFGHFTERGFFAILLGLAIVGCVSLVLAQAGLFGITGLAATLAILSLLYLRRARTAEIEPDPGVAGRADMVPALLLAALLAFAAAVFTPPFQTTLWAGDATLYVGYGVHIGRTGAYMTEDPLLQTMPVEQRRELFRNQTPNDLTGEFARLPGGVAIADIERGSVAAGFAPMFPVLVAIFSVLFGAANVFWIAPLLGMGSVAAVFFLGRALAGNAAGFSAGLLLAACMPQIWFSRIPMSEISSQFFLIGGTWLALRFLRTGERRVAIASGFVLGVASLTGLDVLVAEVLAVAAFAAFALIAGRRVENTRFFVATFGSMLIYAVAHLAYYPSNYQQFFALRLTRLPFSDAIVGTLSASGLGTQLLLGAIGVGAAGLALVLVVKTARHRHAFGLLLAAGGALALAVYLVPLRPRSHAIVGWMAAYLSWPVLALFGATCVGTFAIWARGRGDPDAARLLAAFLVGALPVMYDPQIQNFGVHLGTMRRFVPFVIPGILVVASVGLVRATARSPLALRRVISPAAVALLVALVAWPSSTLVRTSFWGDGVAQSDALAAIFPDDAIVLVSQELAGIQIQSTLTLFYGRTGLLVFRDYRRPRLVEDQMVDWLRGGRNLFLLASDDGIHFQAPAVELTEYDTRHLALRVLEDSTMPPRNVQIREARLNVYRIHLIEGARRAIDLGSYASDAMFQLDGFHGTEQEGEETYRWTGPRSSIEIPARRRIRLVVAGPPLGLPPSVVSIWVDSRLVVENRIIASTPTRIVVDVDSLVSDTMTVRIDSSTFNPRRAGLSGDARELGIRLYGIELDS